MILDLIFRRGNPTNQWVRPANLTLVADLLVPSINQVTVGSPIDALSFLGRNKTAGGSPNFSRLSCLDFTDLGLLVDNEDDGSFSGFVLVLEDPLDEFTPFSGVIKLNNSQVDPANLVQKLGDPYWIDRDEDETLMFYEYPNHEIVIEQSLNGLIQRVGVSTFPTMADAEQREHYGVDKAWPPQ